MWRNGCFQKNIALLLIIYIIFIIITFIHINRNFLCRIWCGDDCLNWSTRWWSYELNWTKLQHRAAKRNKLYFFWQQIWQECIIPSFNFINPIISTNIVVIFFFSEKLGRQMQPGAIFDITYVLRQKFNIYFNPSHPFARYMHKIILWSVKRSTRCWKYCFLSKVEK